VTEWGGSGERWRENGEKKGLTDSTSWRVKILVDMVDGGEEDVNRERRNTVWTSDEIKGRNRHVILCEPIPGIPFGASPIPGPGTGESGKCEGWSTWKHSQY